MRDCLWLVSIRNCRLWWFGYVERMDKDTSLKKCREIAVDGHGGGGGGGGVM